LIDKGAVLWDNVFMEHISGQLKNIEANIELMTQDPVVRGGFTQIPNFVLREPTLSLGAKLTYAMFLSYAWNNNFCYPGQEKLAHDMGTTDRSVRTYLNELKDRGLLEVKQRGLGKTNLYKLNFVAKQKKKN
jgi:hypothetical protein